MGAYTFVSRLEEKLPVLEHFAYGVQIWTQITTRKDHLCAVCGEWHAVGAKMYHPITNGTNRWERICPSCMLTLTGKG